MADFTTIDPNALLPGSPFTAPIANAMYDNPIAIAEGALAAPKVQGIALSNVWLGRRATYSAAAAERVSVIWVWYSGVGTVTGDGIAFSTDGGGSYGATQAFPDDLTAVGHYAVIDFVTPRITTYAGNTSTPTVPAGYDAFQIVNGGGAKQVNMFILGGAA